MIVFIPIAHCLIEDLSMEVLNSITRQNCIPYVYSISDFDAGGGRFKAIAKVRNEIVELAKKIDDEFIVMNDYDVIHEKDNIKDMLNFLKENKDFGGVALTPKKNHELEPNHIGMYCVMFRREALKEFDATPEGSCECLSIAKSIRKNWRYGLLEKDNNGRIKHEKV